MTILDKMGSFKLFGVGVVLSLMQFRFIALVLLGAANHYGSQTVNHRKPHLCVRARSADGMAVADPCCCIPGAGGVP
jgi:hypothetical protein